MESVSGIHEIDPGSRRPRETFVHGIVDALVGFRDPKRYLIGVLFYDIDGAIAAASVNDDILDVRICLPKYRKDCLFDARY